MTGLSVHIVYTKTHLKFQYSHEAIQNMDILHSTPPDSKSHVKKMPGHRGLEKSSIPEGGGL